MRGLLFILFFSSTLMAFEGTRIIQIDGQEYFARPNVEIKFCPDYNLSTMFFVLNSKYMKCIYGIEENGGFEDARMCFHNSLNKVYFFSDLKSLGLSKSCYNRLSTKCRDYSFDINTGSIKFPNGFSYQVSSGNDVEDVLTFVTFDTTALYAVAAKNFV